MGDAEIFERWHSASVSLRVRNMVSRPVREVGESNNVAMAERNSKFEKKAFCFINAGH